jgi:hypothetical protein
VARVQECYWTTTPFAPVVGSFVIASMMASCSALNIDDWSHILLRVDRLRPLILRFLPFLTLRCRSLCGRGIFRLPVLFLHFTERPIHTLLIVVVKWRSYIGGSFLHFSSIDVHLSEKFCRSYEEGFC